MEVTSGSDLTETRLFVLQLLYKFFVVKNQVCILRVTPFLAIQNRPQYNSNLKTLVTKEVLNPVCFSSHRKLLLGDARSLAILKFGIHRDRTEADLKGCARKQNCILSDQHDREKARGLPRGEGLQILLGKAQDPSV